MKKQKKESTIRDRNRWTVEATGEETPEEFYESLSQLLISRVDRRAAKAQSEVSEPTNKRSNKR